MSEARATEIIDRLEADMISVQRRLTAMGAAMDAEAKARGSSLAETAEVREIYGITHESVGAMISNMAALHKAMQPFSKLRAGK